MRLRATNTAPRLGRRWMALARFFSLGVAAVDRGYWSTFFRNVLTRILAFIVRGLRIRVDKIRVWKDRGSWEYKAEQFVLAGCAVGVFGSKYSLSVNELYINVCKRPVSDPHLYQPVNANLELRKGVEIIAYLTPRFFTLLRPRRLAILDDLRFSVSVRDVKCTAPHVMDATITHVAIELCPGYSRSLRAKLPPSAPATKRPRRPGILRYWEGNGALHGLKLQLAVPMATRDAANANACAAMSLPKPDGDAFKAKIDGNSNGGSENGVFMRVESIRVDAYGKAADERHEAMTRMSVNVRGCSMGSTVVDALSYALYEAAAAVEESQHRRDHDNIGMVESTENIDKIVAARPEALLWIEDVTTAVDVNCSKRHAMRVDVGGNGGVVVAVEPVGLVDLLNDIHNFTSKYVERPPRPRSSSSSMEIDNGFSVARTASSGSLQSSEGEPTSLRIVADVRHWTGLVLGHGPVGEGDTLAIVASCESIIVPQIDIFGTSPLRIAGSTTKFVLMHWSQWARTTNVTCEEAKFEINRGIQNGKHMVFRKLAVDWDLDFQSGLEIVPTIFRALKHLQFSVDGNSAAELDSSELFVPCPSQPIARTEAERPSMTESERADRRERRRKHLMDTLGSWTIGGSDVSMKCSFPDGPNLGLSVTKLPTVSLNAHSFVGYNAVLSIQGKKCAYGAELKLGSPFHTLHRALDKRRIDIDVQGLKLILYHDFPFGYLLQDWILRLRSVIKISTAARLKRRGLASQRSKKRPIPDIYFASSGVDIYFEDHPLGGYLTQMLPLMQDEASERLAREELMAAKILQLHKIARAEIAGTAKRCIDGLRARHASIWVDRVRRLKGEISKRKIADGYLPSLRYPPVATFAAASLSFAIVMDDEVRENGSRESIRRLKMLDDYELGSKKHNKTRHYESDAWNSIGFRTVSFEARGVRLSFRDYNTAFVVIDRMRFDNTIMGQAVQATLPPYVAATTVGIGRRRLAKVVKGLGPTKTYADIHLVIDTLQSHFNPAFLGAISEFGRGISRFFAGGKNPSPRVPWFDTLRVNMHGRMRLTAKKLKGWLTSAVSPYAMTKHYAEIEADDFEMLASRLEATRDDPCPVSWKFHNWHIRPHAFGNGPKSEVVFDFVRVGLNPVFTVLSGDPQDHYFIPFPSKEDVLAGGPGIGRGKTTLLYAEDPVIPMDNGFGNFTTWKTGLHEIPGYDSLRDFKTESVILGIDIFVRHPQVSRASVAKSQEMVISGDQFRSFSSTQASVLYSDAISTLMKVVKSLIRRPVSCRLAPRRNNLSRKPPSKTGISSTLKGLNVSIDAKHLNVMLYNNLEPGHGLFISIDSLDGELWKRTEISRSTTGSIKRTSKLTRRRFNVVDFYSSIQVPELDMAVDSNDMGKLLTVDKISLSDNVQDEMRYPASPSSKSSKKSPSSGFGSDDLSESPFYTFSETHPLQRGKKLDKSVHDKRLLVDRVRLIWSPKRRTSVFAWPDAFKEKSFSMKASKRVYSKTFSDFPHDSRSKQASDDQFSNLQTRQSFGSGRNANLAEEFCDDTGVNIPPLKLSSSHPKQEASVNAKDQVLESDEVAHLDSADILRMLSKANSAPVSSGSPDPLSPLTVSASRAKVSANRRPIGSMVDLLNTKMSMTGSRYSSAPADSHHGAKSRSALEVLKTSPKFALFINDCEVAFGSPQTSGTVFLTSKAVRVGVVDKRIQKNLQLGEKNEKWSDREYRVHLNEANLYTLSKSIGKFDFSEKNWVCFGGDEHRRFALVTTNPICMDLMYISSSSIPKEDTEEEEEDHILRPSLVFINIPDISMTTNADEFHAAVDVVRKVLMQRMRSSELVNEELNKLRYELQLVGGKVASDDLDDFMRRLNNVTKQFLYAGDTFQPELVEALMLPDETSFADNLLRYKAKAKAVATYVRQDQRASSTDVLYPAMYISYSFDKCSWELREKRRELNKETEDPFVEITLEDLVCRHIFYVGRGSSTEITFGNISAQNKMRSSYFQGILQPLRPEGSRGKLNRIKASDGAPVAFRWYSTQEDRVGGIQVYDLLTIQVAPMAAAVTRKLYSSVSGFIFSTRSRPSDEKSLSDGTPRRTLSRNGSRGTLTGANTVSPSSDGRTLSVDISSRKGSSAQSSSALTLRRNMDDVSQMAQRGESSILFKYIFIDAFELTASYKNKETKARGVLDFFDLFVTTPSFSYSSKVWTWKDFSARIRRDLVMTFARRGVSNLAKIKLLPGYSRARKRFVQGADMFRESIYNRLPSAGSGVNEAEDRSEEEGSSVNEEDSDNDMREEKLEESSSSEDGEEDRIAAIDAALVDISVAEGRRRENILKALYGSRAVTVGISRSPSRHAGRRHGASSRAGSESSLDGTLLSGNVSMLKPPIPPGDRSRTTSTPSRGSLEEEGPRGLLSRLRRRAQDYR